MKILIILLIVFNSTTLFCQLRFVNSDKYYNEFYFVEEGDCFRYKLEEESFRIEEYQIENNFLKLKILATDNNLFQIYSDDQGFFIPYDKSGFQNYFMYLMDSDRDKLHEISIHPFNLPDEIIDTIFIVRNLAQKKWITKESSKDGFTICEVDSPVEITRLHVLSEAKIDTTIDIGNIIEVEIEFMENDFITGNPKIKVVCPKKIDRELIRQLNSSLIDFGYLTESDRKTYIPEIKEALIKFQNDYQLKSGLIDNSTLDMLGINYE